MLTLHEMPGHIRLPVIAEMVRVMKQDGLILFVDFHPGPIRFPKGWLYKIIILFFEITAGREHFRNYRDFIAGMLKIYRPKFGDPVILNHLENVCLMIRLHQTGLIKTEEETKEQ